MKVLNTNLSQETTNLIQQIIDPVSQQYISFHYNENEKEFVKKYNFVKDQSWPDCKSYNNFDSLPDQIKEECINIHGFSPQIYLDNIKKDSGIQKFDFLKVYDDIIEFLLKHKNIIENQNIVDFACKQGELSFFAAFNNANSVLAMDIRKKNIDIACLIMNDSNIKDSLKDSKLDFVISDIHDYQSNRQFCCGKNTAFLLGIMYHVHDHVDIIESIFSNNVENIVIESGIFEHEEPLIWWKTENTFDLRSGWHKSKNDIIVGHPTVSWFDLIANCYGYHKVDQKKYNISTEFHSPRAILLYKKIK